MLEQALVNHTFHLGITDTIHEIANSLRCIATTAQTADCRHTRVIPTCNESLLNQLEHLTLGHHRIGNVEAVELALFRTVVRAVRRESGKFGTGYLVEEIIVQRTVHFELERTDRVRYALEIVGLSVREIVHRIDIPLATCTVVRMSGDDTIHDRVTEVHVRIGHVDLGTEHHLAILYLATLHSLEETQVLLDWTVAVRRSYTRFGRRTFLFGYLLGGLLVHISLALLDKTDSEIVELLEIVGGIIDITPTESEPSDILLDGIDVFYIFFNRVGVIETQVANTIVLLGDTEVHADGFDVADMQVTIRLRRETCLNTSVVHALSEVFLDDLLNEVERFFFFAFNRHVCFFHICKYLITRNIQ